MSVSVTIHTLGCKLNYSESSSIARQFVNKGILVKEYGEQSDIFVLNTCTVTSNADKEARQIIRSVLRDKPDTFVVITGCYAQLKPEEIASLDGVDLILGSNDKYKITDYIEGYINTDLSCVDKRERAEVFVSPLEDIEFAEGAFTADVDSRTRAFLKVQDGCDYNCSFCTIPMARGNSRPLQLDKIIENAKKIIDAGFKEIVLTGVNIGDYKTSNGNKLINVLYELDKLPIPRIRISSIEPNLLTDEIIGLYKDSNKFCRHFHIPLQSGDSEILRIMKRRYNLNLYQDLIYKIKEILPECGIGVDVITGFPGETEEMHKNCFNYLQDLPVSYLHVFSYSERPNTNSAGLNGKVNPYDIKKRSKELRELSAMKRFGFYSLNTGTVQKVLFESEKNGNIEGWTESYIRTRIPFINGIQNEIKRVKLNKPEGIKPVLCEIIN